MTRRKRLFWLVLGLATYWVGACWDKTSWLDAITSIVFIMTGVLVISYGWAADGTRFKDGPVADLLRKEISRARKDHRDEE